MSRLPKQTLRSTADPALPQELLDYLDGAEEAAHNNLARAYKEQAPAIQQFQRELRELMTPAVPAKAKVIRLRFLADAQSKLMTPYSACKSQCSHCCNVDVLVPLGEAKLIGKAIGRAVATPATTFKVGSKPPTSYAGAPCPFLKEGRCSIYAHRPLVCRTLVNMDSSPKLCELIPGRLVPVPYLNTMETQAYLAYLHQDEPFADIRDWFPG